MVNEKLLIEDRPITIRPVYPEDLKKLVLRCWPEMETLKKVFHVQKIIGFAAWEADDRCVAQLHCYNIEMAHGKSVLWPSWSNWWDACGEKIKKNINIFVPL